MFIHNTGISFLNKICSNDNFLEFGLKKDLSHARGMLYNFQYITCDFRLKSWTLHFVILDSKKVGI